MKLNRLSKKQQQFNQEKKKIMEKVILKSISAYSDYVDELPINYKDSWLMHRKYVEFLDQPLNLGMFVPAWFIEGIWVVLYEPKKYQEWLKAMEIDEINCFAKGYEKCAKFHQAKMRVLFEGFNFEYRADLEKWSILYRNDFSMNYDDKYKTFEVNSFYLHFVEDLLDEKLELTPTAQKQIGL